MTKVIIPYDKDYRNVVRNLVGILQGWGLGCQAKGSNDDQVIMDPDTKKEYTLSEDQRETLTRSLPQGVQVIN